MKFKIPFSEGDEELNMAPMIDMVFLLLIFFMVASHLNDLERVPVLLPVAEQAKVPKDVPNRQLISITADDASGEKVTFFINQQSLNLEQFEEEIDRIASVNPDVQIYLRADRRVLHKHIKSVMSACAEAGIIDIAFGTFESGN